MAYEEAMATLFLPESGNILAKTIQGNTELGVQLSSTNAKLNYVDNKTVSLAVIHKMYCSNLIFLKNQNKFIW